MEQIKNIIISYWFKELSFNPKDKIDELDQEIGSVFNNSFMFNDENINHLISMPRIQVMDNDKNYLFQMSLINAVLTINVNNMDIDEVILLINNNAQLFFDAIKNVYDTRIFYTSIKIEMIEEIKNSINVISKLFDLADNYEDLSIKRGFIKDNYYINYILNSGHEYNFNVKKDEHSLEQDVFDRTLITSLSQATLNKEFILKIIEVNDRYAFNQDANYLSSKDSIRGMIIELKDSLENKLYNNKKI